MHTFLDNHDKTWMLHLKIDKFVRHTLVAEVGINLMHPAQCTVQLSNAMDVPAITEQVIWLMVQEQAAEIEITDPEVFWGRFDSDEVEGCKLLLAYQALEDELRFFIRRLYSRRPELMKALTEVIAEMGARRTEVIRKCLEWQKSKEITGAVLEAVEDQILRTVATGNSPGPVSVSPVSET